MLRNSAYSLLDALTGSSSDYYSDEESSYSDDDDVEEVVEPPPGKKAQQFNLLINQSLSCNSNECSICLCEFDDTCVSTHLNRNIHWS